MCEETANGTQCHDAPPCPPGEPCGPPPMCKDDGNRTQCHEAPPCPPGEPCGPPPCNEGEVCPPPCKQEGNGSACARPPHCPPGEPCGPPPCEPEKPCGPPECSPERPCAPGKPDFCDDNADGSMTCSPPPECEGKVGEGNCMPPPWCEATSDGRFKCRPPDHGEGKACPPDAPCAGNPPPPPPCQPDGNGNLVCQPPPECGGAAFGGGGAAGCTPPEFCTAQGDGTYVCKPPKECRKSDDGVEKCFDAAASGQACSKAQHDSAAQGKFTPCAPAAQQYCPPPAPGSAPGTQSCRAPPPPPRFCTPGETQFPHDHPRGAPPVCMQPPSMQDGKYVPPARSLQGDHGPMCTPPPPGEWPPAQRAPEGSVWCPPAGYAPPPAQGAALDAWKVHTNASAPPKVAHYVNRAGDNWAKINESALIELNKAGSVNQVLAPPSFDGRTVDGTFIGGTVEDDLTMRDFTVGGAKFFKQTKPNGGGNQSFSTVAGSTVIAASGSAIMETHNTPSGLLAYRSVAGTAAYNVEMDVEDGYNVSKDENGLIVLERDGWKGVLIGNGAIKDGKINVTVEGTKSAFFMAVPPTGLEAETRMDIAKGIQKRAVFAEVSLVERNKTIAQSVAMYEDDEAFSVDVTNSSTDKMELVVSGEGEGQAVVFTVDRESLTTPLSQFAVTMDGNTMKECATFDAMTQSAKQGGCFHLAANETVLRVSVMPEHFSTHTIAIGSVTPAPKTTSALPVEEAVEKVATETPETPAVPEVKDTTGAIEEAPSEEAPATDATNTPAEKPAETPGPGLVALVIGVGSAALAFRRRRA